MQTEEEFLLLDVSRYNLGPVQPGAKLVDSIQKGRIHPVILAGHWLRGTCPEGRGARKMLHVLAAELGRDVQLDEEVQAWWDYRRVEFDSFTDAISRLFGEDVWMPNLGVDGIWRGTDLLKWTQNRSTFSTFLFEIRKMGNLELVADAKLRIDKEKLYGLVEGVMRPNIHPHRVFWVLCQLQAQLSRRDAQTSREIIRSCIFVNYARSWVSLYACIEQVFGEEVWKPEVKVPVPYGDPSRPPPPPPPSSCIVIAKKRNMMLSDQSCAILSGVSVPKVILAIVLSKSPMLTLLACAQVSRLFRQVSEDDVVWARFLRDGNRYRDVRAIHRSFGESSRVAKMQVRSQLRPLLKAVRKGEKLSCTVCPRFDILLTRTDLNEFVFLFRGTESRFERPLFVCPSCARAGSFLCRNWYTTLFVFIFLSHFYPRSRKSSPVSHDFLQLMLDISARRAACESCMRSSAY